MKWCNITTWFKEWEFLKCSDHEWNYARIVGLFFGAHNICTVDLSIIPQINTPWAALCFCKGLFGMVLLFLFEIWRSNKRVEFKVGDKTYGFNKE